MYLLSDEMRHELLSTFRYARDRALKNRDEDSANYYWGLVEYLQGLPKYEKPVKTSKKKPKQLPKPKPINLKDFEKLLREDDSLSKSEKFDLYYEERESQREDKEGYTYEELLKKANLKKPR